LVVAKVIVVVAPVAPVVVDDDAMVGVGAVTVVANTDAVVMRAYVPPVVAE
jgi:hypothetical protein